MPDLHGAETEGVEFGPRRGQGVLAVGRRVVERDAHVVEARGELVGAPGRQDQAIHRLRVEIVGPGRGIQAPGGVLAGWEGAGGQRAPSGAFQPARGLAAKTALPHRIGRLARSASASEREPAVRAPHACTAIDAGQSTARPGQVEVNRANRSRIPLGVQPPQIQSPLEIMSTFAQLQGVREQTEARRVAGEEARQKAADQAAIRRIFAESNGDVAVAIPRLRTINPKLTVFGGRYSSLGTATRAPTSRRRAWSDTPLRPAHCEQAVA